MKKKFLLIALAMTAMFCLFAAVACSGSDTPVSENKEPTLQQRFEQFGQTLQSAGSFEVRTYVTIEGEDREIVISAEKNRAYKSMPIGGELFEYFLLYKEGFIYQLACVGGQKNQSNITYTGAQSMDAVEAVNSVASMLMIPDFYGQMLKNASYGTDTISFAFAGATDGRIALQTDSLQIEFVSELVGKVRVVIDRVGKNTVDFGELTEEDLTRDFDAYDHIFAEMDWVMHSDSASVTSLLTEGTVQRRIVTEYSDGEMLQTVYDGSDVSAQPSEIEAYVRGEGGYVNVLFSASDNTSQTGDGPVPSVIGANWTGGHVADVFVPFGVTDRLFSETFFDLAPDSDEKVVLSEIGKEKYPACQDLLIDLSEEGRYTVSITFRTGYGFPDTAEITIGDVGEEKTLSFPEGFREQGAWLQNGILYSRSGDGCAQVERLSPDAGFIVLPDEIGVNGEIYTVTSLSMTVLTGEEDLEYIVLPATITQIGGLRFASLLEKVYYEGTREQFEAVGGLLPESVDIYYYSEEQPSAHGLYWHWNETGNVPEPWPVSFSDEVTERIQEIAQENSFSLTVRISRENDSKTIYYRADNGLILTDRDGEEKYSLFKDGYVYTLEDPYGTLTRTITAADKEDISIPVLLNSILWDALMVKDLYSSAVSIVSESGKPEFEILYPDRDEEDYGSHIVQNGTVSLTDDGLILSCEAYNVFETSYLPAPYSVTVTIGDLGYTEVQLPDGLTEWDFTDGVSDLDLFIADLNRFMNADSGTLFADVSYDRRESQRNYAFSDGEMLCTQTKDGLTEPVFAVTERGYLTYIEVGPDDSDTALSATSYSNGHGMRIGDADLFQQIGLQDVIGHLEGQDYDFSALKDCFESAGGTSYTLTEEALAMLNGITELTVSLNEKGVNVIQIRGEFVDTESGRPIEIEIWIEAYDIGVSEPIYFPSEITALADSFYENVNA